MTKENKIIFKYKDKKYEIEAKTEEQKAKPKGEDAGTEITVKDYQKGFWNHTANIDGEIKTVKWGTGRKITIFGVVLLVIGLLLFGLYRWYSSSKEEPEKEKEDD
jgi:hypothetical protein